MQNSLRFRLIIILIILAIGPLLLAASLIAQRSFAFEREQAYNLQDQVAQNISTEIRSVFLGINNDLNTLGNEIRSLESPDQAQLLSLLLRTISSGTHNDFYDELTLLDQNGQEIVRLSAQEIVANTDLVNRAEQDVFTQTISSRSTYYSPPTVDLGTGKAFIMIAIPLYLPRSTTLNSILVARIKIDAFGNTLGDTRAGENQTIYLTDANGNVLAHQDRTLDLRNKQIQLPGTTTTQIGLAGENVIRATDRILLGNQTLYLIAEKPVSVALEIAKTIIFTITIVILLALVIAGVVGYFAVRQIVVPIEDLASLAGRIADGDLSQTSPTQRRDEIGVLAKTFNSMTSQLRDLISSLERRVDERTADLNTARLLSERRAQDLQSISEISRAISTERRLEILLPLITRLVSERFGFYHAGIFFVDDTHRYAYLQAANSEGGQRMLARGHRLEIGKGLVGTVTQTGKARIALDVGSDAVFFNNPDLPNTHSEMALPLEVRGQTIGVLDVQSTKPGAFTQNDVNTLSILADQIAIAIENARLFNQTQQAKDEAEALYAQIQRQEWSTLINKGTRIGYRQTAIGGKILERPIETDDIREALENGQVVVLNGEATTNMNQPAITVPVKLRGQTIGVLNIKAPTMERKWNQDEINLAQAISDRLAFALDNARLFEETTQRAERERLVSEITGKIRSHNDPQAMIETAMQELRNALGASRVEIIPKSTGNKDKE